MKTETIILAVALILSLAPAVSLAIDPPPAPSMIGLFADEARTDCVVRNPGGFNQFVMWIWVLPGENGMICAEYQIATPYNVIVTDLVPNATVVWGDPITSPGVSICFDQCHTDWVWTYQVVFWVTDTSPSMITVEPHEASGGIFAGTCEEGYPTEEMNVYVNLFINQDIGTEESSWGSIKRVAGR